MKYEPTSRIPLAAGGAAGWLEHFHDVREQVTAKQIKLAQYTVRILFDRTAELFGDASAR